MYKPVRPRSLWEYNDQWSLVKQRKSETIQGFAGRIQSLQEKLKECGLILPASVAAYTTTYSPRSTIACASSMTHRGNSTKFQRHPS
jgi:hypothetical protein